MIIDHQWLNIDDQWSSMTTTLWIKLVSVWKLALAIGFASTKQAKKQCTRRRVKWNAPLNVKVWQATQKTNRTSAHLSEHWGAHSTLLSPGPHGFRHDRISVPSTFHKLWDWHIFFHKAVYFQGRVPAHEANAALPPDISEMETLKTADPIYFIFPRFPVLLTPTAPTSYVSNAILQGGGRSKFETCQSTKMFTVFAQSTAVPNH